MHRKFGIIAVLCVLALGCGRDMSSEAILARAHSAVLASTGSGAEEINRNDAIDDLESFMVSFPAHADMDSATFMLASLYRVNGDFGDAAKMLVKLHRTIPESRYAVRSLVLAGDIFENQLKDNYRARAVYERLIENYPEHEFVTNGSAAWLLNNLGKSPEDWDIPFPVDSLSEATGSAEAL